MLKPEQTRRPLRVAIVASSSRLGGAEKQTFYMAAALLEAGIDVRFFNLGPGGHYESRLRQIGVPLCQIYIANPPFAILARLIRALYRWRPHVMLASQFDDTIYGGIAGRCCHALTLAGIRSDGLSELGSRGGLGRWMFRLAHGFIANSHRAKQNLVSRGIKPHRIQVLPNVIDLPDFDSRRSLPLALSLSTRRVIAAAVGSLHLGKRFDRFVDALALARHREPALAGVIAGTDCGSKTGLQEHANALGLTRDDLTFLGECDRVPALLAQAAFLVLSSDCEGFPNVILEAMAARLPVITTPAGDAGLVVQDSKTGFVVAMDDVQGMADCMVRLAQSPAMRTEFGEAGRKRVEQEYDFESLVDRLAAIFQIFAMQVGKAPLVELLSGIPWANEEICATYPA